MSGSPSATTGATERALDARRGDVACREFHVIEDIRFDRWADQWLASFADKANAARVYGSRPAYFTDAELARLWPELAYWPLYLYLCKFAVALRARYATTATSGETVHCSRGSTILL